MASRWTWDAPERWEPDLLQSVKAVFACPQSASSKTNTACSSPFSEKVFSSISALSR